MVPAGRIRPNRYSLRESETWLVPLVGTFSFGTLLLPAFQQSFQFGDRFEILRAPGGLLELNKSLKLDASAPRSEDFYFEAICQQAL